jgi:acetyl-CoA carboxylase biotin carboxylase subunit
VRRVLIANRGEIALRVIRACRQAGLETIAVYSEPDANSPHIWAADEAVCIGPAAPLLSYLNGDAILHVAKARGCDAIHPGYGFLAENAAFATSCEENGVTFIGPSAESIRTMGDKAEARRAAIQLGVPVVPGSQESFVELAAAAGAAGDIGFPVLLKARSGGGGRGMRVVEDVGQFEGLFQQATAEAAAAFGDGGVYLERYFKKVRHIEVQVLGDGQGKAVHLWERDCSTQRRHQKLVEEALSPVLDAETREAICNAAISLTTGIDYRGAGTVEFLYDPADQEFYFIEMNTRIQVEHPVTEMLTGVDLVAEQLRIADGQGLTFDAPPRAFGHAIEFRINAEDPAQGFQPSPGRIEQWRPPSGQGVRLDSHVYPGFEVPTFYDSLLGKLIVQGVDRADALAKARLALSRFLVTGVATTIPFHLDLLEDPEFQAGDIHTGWVEARAKARAS